MPTPNYGYEKRQKELAKKRKKEDKLRERAERKSGAESGGAPEDSPAEDEQRGEGMPPAQSLSASG